jgi:hypothetical protein
MNLQRRQFLHLAAGAAALPIVSRAAGAETYPIHSVTTIVVPGNFRNQARDQAKPGRAIQERFPRANCSKARKVSRRHCRRKFDCLGLCQRFPRGVRGLRPV